ncbi:RNA polymerase sigma factor [Candidatus Aquicultor sp.]
MRLEDLVSLDVRSPHEQTNDIRSNCPLSSTKTSIDKCIKEHCSAFISNTEKCFYVIAAGFGLEIIERDGQKAEHNVLFMHDFQAVFTEHYDRVCRIAYRMLRDREMAEDVAQEVFVKAYKNARTVEPGMPLAAWLYRVTTNLCLDELRRRKTLMIEPRADFDVDEIHKKFKICQPSNPEMALDEVEDRMLIGKVLQSLPPHYCQALIMKCVDNLSYEDIAYAMDTTVAGIRSIIFRARRQFIKLYMELAEEAGQTINLSDLPVLN